MAETVLGASVVFSAHAEMFPKWTELRRWSSSFLCVCRDVSTEDVSEVHGRPFSLYLQRCFRIELGSVAD